VGRQLTVYGSGKVNVNTANRAVLYGVIRPLIDGTPPSDQTIWDAVDAFVQARSVPLEPGAPTVYIRQPSQIVQVFATQITPSLVLSEDNVDKYITTQSKVFRIRSVGEVGDARAEAEMVVDFTNGGTGRIVYWNVR